MNTKAIDLVDINLKNSGLKVSIILVVDFYKHIINADQALDPNAEPEYITNRAYLRSKTIPLLIQTHYNDIVEFYESAKATTLAILS